MSLIQISEPGQAPEQHKKRLAAGIDLGTTNSLVAVSRDGVSTVIDDSDGNYLLPSVVYYSKDEPPLTGYDAKLKAVSDPLNTIASVKRLMGRGLEDIGRFGSRFPYKLTKSDQGAPLIATVSGDVSPVQVSAEILKTLKLRAERNLGGELDGVVITVPAYFDDAQRQATKDAARLAGLDVLRLLNEPTAAAVAYGLDRGSEGIHVIYYMGGGTFDISILRFSKGVFEVIATAGDSNLGGDDIDSVIAEWLIKEADINDDASHGQLRHIWNEARMAKEALTDQSVVALDIDTGKGSRWHGELSRGQFAKLAEPVIQHTLAPCRRALRDAGIEVNDIQEIVMVGGVTRIPLVREMVGEFFGKPPLVDIDPEKVVAIGAAIQADILVGNKRGDDMLLLDVIPLSLGLGTMGGLSEKIIGRNTTIPVARAQEFTTYKDGQTAMMIHVVQGERELVEDCRSLARLELRGIPPLPAGAARIRVTFQVDADGILNVSAVEETSGVSSHVEVKPSYGLQEAEIEQMLRDSLDNAEVDIKARHLREAQVEAKRLIEAVASALAADGSNLLSREEYKRIEDSLKNLQQAIGRADYNEIRKLTTRLDEASADFAARRMDANIKKVLAGHSITDFERK